MMITKKRGMSLLELMIALTVLVVGLLALMGLVTTAIASNTRNRTDTSGTFVAQIFIENILKQPNATAITVTDCAGNNITVQSAPPVTANTGIGANLMTDGSGRIDFSQSASTVANGYHAMYVGCGDGSRNTTYDVRWNVWNISPYSRQVTVAARINSTVGAGSASLGGVYFAIPANLRSIVTTY
jgi:prepilin-type N-terminal cleavage/methylation domain-containing protein